MATATGDVQTINQTHNQDLVKQLNDFRRDNAFCDLTLTCEGKRVSVHKVVLSTGSPVLKDVLLCDTDLNIIDVDYTNLTTLVNVVDYLYTGCIHLSVDNVLDIYKLARKWNISSLSKLTNDKMTQKLSVDDCIVMWQNVNKIGAPMEIEQHTSHDEVFKDFILRNFAAVFKSAHFKDLSLHDLKFFINSEFLHVKDESEVFSGVMLWIESDIQRRECLETLMEDIKLPLMTLAFLRKTVEKHHLIRRSAACLQFVNEAKNSHIYRIDPTNDVEPSTKRNVPRKGFVVSVGGCAKNYQDSISLMTAEFYKDADKWFPLPNMNQGRCYFGLVVIEGLLYAIGGFDGPKSLSSCEVLRGLSEQWEQIRPMKTARSAMGCCAVSGSILVCGGQTDGGKPTDRVESYSPSTNQWTDITPLPTPISGLTASGIKGMMYIAGGRIPGVTGAPGLTGACWRIDLDGDLTWRQTSPMKYARYTHASVTDGRRIFVSGGLDGVTVIGKKLYAGNMECRGRVEQANKFVEVYDVDNDTWSECLPLPQDRCGHGVGLVGEEFLIVGGAPEGLLRDGQNIVKTTDNVWISDRKSKTWGHLASLSTPRFGTAVAQWTPRFLLEDDGPSMAPPTNVIDQSASSDPYVVE